jgi:hypothetical protein
VAVGAFAGIVSDAVNRHNALVDEQGLNNNIARLQSPIINTDVTYEVAIPIGDPRLTTLRNVIINSSRKLEYKYNHGRPPMGVLPRFPLTEILARLPPMDAGIYFLRSMDIEVDLYRPPFPASPEASESSVNGSPDLVLGTEYVSPLPETLGKEIQLPGTLGALPAHTPYVVYLCGCNPQDYFTRPAPFVSAYDVPIKRAYHSRRLDSLLDLAGSLMVIHIRPDLTNAARDPSVTQKAMLKRFTLSIDGVNYHVDLKKALVGAAPLFTYYELMIPDSWNSQSQTIP